MSITTHLLALLEHFDNYFPEKTAPEQYDWIKSPFSHLSAVMEDALMELSCEHTLKIDFNFFNFF